MKPIKYIPCMITFAKNRNLFQEEIILYKTNIEVLIIGFKITLLDCALDLLNQEKNIWSF